MKLFIVIILLLTGFLPAFCQSDQQNQDQTNQQISQQTNNNAAGSGEIIEAGESLIKVEIEKPQVQLFSQRIKPEFDEVNLEKSFIKEIVDLGQLVEIDDSNNKKVELIDVEKILNKSR